MKNYVKGLTALVITILVIWYTQDYYDVYGWLEDLLYTNFGVADELTVFTGTFGIYYTGSWIAMEMMIATAKTFYNYVTEEIEEEPEEVNVKVHFIQAD